MAIVKCVMMQRDESLLLEPWLRYYGYLFGFENLTVIDNGSTSEPVIATLRRFERIGVRIYWDFGGAENYAGKGFHFHNIIEGWDFGGGYDFALPVDCDEFIAVMHPDGLDCGRRAIHRELDSLKGEERALGIEFSMFNVPGQPGCYRPQPYPKGFFARNTIKVLDHGHHYPVSRAGGRRETELTYLHYHHKPLDMMRQRARRELHGRIDIDHPEIASAYSGFGNHLIKFLTMSEQEYRTQFADSLLIRFDGFERLLHLLGPADHGLFPNTGQTAGDDATADRLLVRVAGSGARKPSFAPFSESAYYALNPDVAANRIEALKHYFRHGYDERRAVQPIADTGRKRRSA